VYVAELLAPRGRIAFVSNLSGLPQVWTVDANSGWPELVTALDDQIYAVSWSPQGEWLASLLAPGGGMNQQIFLVRLDGSGLRRLTGGGRDNNWLGRWSHDERSLLLSSNRRDPATLDAYRIRATVAIAGWFAQHLRSGG
jgi:Tol biopolymer transport system component